VRLKRECDCLYLPFDGFQEVSGFGIGSGEDLKIAKFAPTGKFTGFCRGSLLTISMLGDGRGG